MKQLCLLIKPSSDKCNMRCKYCFYADIAEKHSESLGFMTEKTAENLIKSVMNENPSKVTFMFQGGEPTLIGLDFYRFFTECVKKNNRCNAEIFYAIQTNAYLIDIEWAEFLKNNHFLVGVSLDGTKELHDLFRVDKSGNGTASTVMKSAALLKKFGVEFNILTVVTNPLARKAEAVYNFYKKQGFQYLQFIPCLNPLDDMETDYDFSLSPERYGKFLIRLFDLWVRDIVNGDAVSIRQFDNYLLMLRGMPPESCGFSGMCSMQNVVEADGSVYPCDFYVLDNLRLGNVNVNSFEEINIVRKETGFIENSAAIDDACRECEYYPICRGGCKRYREPFVDGIPGRNCFCESYKMFFEHALPTLYKLSRY